MVVKNRYCWESIILNNSVRYSLARYTETLFIIMVNSQKIAIFKGNLELVLELNIHVSILFPMLVIVILSLHYHYKTQERCAHKRARWSALFQQVITRLQGTDKTA